MYIRDTPKITQLLEAWQDGFVPLEIKMIETGYYTNQQDKLVKKFKKTLKQYEPRLSAQYGEKFTTTINVDAMAYYIELIPRIPYYETALYRPIILLNAQLIAIVGQIQGGNEG